jgi:hypothetical protein
MAQDPGDRLSAGTQEKISEQETASLLTLTKVDNRQFFFSVDFGLSDRWALLRWLGTGISTTLLSTTR